MKILAAFLLIAAGCDMYERDKNGVAYANSDINDVKKFNIVEVKSRDELHEYMLFSNGNQAGMTHLPNCKHCKERKMK